MMERDFVVLVDRFGHDLVGMDDRLSTVEKMEAHRRGLLHSAVSVFIFNDRNALLLQKRAKMKYHSPEKWTNTCCTHPRPGETPPEAAQRRLKEEMGLAVKLVEAFAFLYTAQVGNGLIENEFDHVFFGVSDQNPNPDPSEVTDWNWTNMEALERGLITNPSLYSAWLRDCFNKVIQYRSLEPNGLSALSKRMVKGRYVASHE